MRTIRLGALLVLAAVSSALMLAQAPAAPTLPRVVAGYAGSCAWPNFPDATCTGVLAGVTRTSSGTINTSSNGQLIQNLNVSGKIIVNHDNVTIRNVKITNPGGVAITQISCGVSCTGLLIEDVELDGTGNSNGASAVDFYNYTLRRANIHHYGEGPGCGGGVLIEDSYLHDFVNFESSGAHQDGIQCEFDDDNIIRHNHIRMNFITGNNANSALVFGGSTQNNIAEYNLFELFTGTAGYGLYPGDNGGSTGYFRHNRWGSQTTNKVYTGYPNGLDVWPNLPCDNKWYDGANAGLSIGAIDEMANPASCAGIEAPPAPAPAPSVIAPLRLGRSR